MAAEINKCACVHACFGCEQQFKKHGGSIAECENCEISLSYKQTATHTERQKGCKRFYSARSIE